MLGVSALCIFNGRKGWSKERGIRRRERIKIGGHNHEVQYKIMLFRSV